MIGLGGAERKSRHINHLQGRHQPHSNPFGRAGVLMIHACKGRVWGITTLVAGTLGLASSASAQLRVMNYNIAHIQGNTAAMQSVLAAAHADDKVGFAVPVAVFMFQEVQSTNVSTLTSLVNGAAPVGVTY